MAIKILIGADIVPTNSNTKFFIEGNVEHLLGNELQSLFEEADYTILNLETPLTDERNEIVKAGPCLIAPTKCINGLKKINSHFYTLANNHILDQGEQGLESTIRCFKENGIEYSGAGKNIDEAKRAFVKDINGIKIGIYCCAEHEFSIAGEKKYGANPYDCLYSFDHVSDLKKSADIVIVLFHGGKEHYRYPSPELQRIFRKFSEVGADFVVAQHTHCVGCIEDFNGSCLVYGQGNFLFDNSNSEYWKTSFLLEIVIDDNKSWEYNIIPCEKELETVRLAKEATRDDIINSLEKRNQEILKPGFIEKRYSEYADEMRKEYFIRLLGKIGRNPIVRILNKITNYKLLDYFYSDTFLPVVENCFGCEAHRELATYVMKRYKRKAGNNE